MVVYKPTNEKVIQAWLKGVSALSSFPAVSSPITNNNWATTPAFMTVRISGISGNLSAYFPERMPRIVISCWAKPKDWATANDVAEQIRDATYSSDSARTVTIPGYDQARILSIEAVSEPTRIESEAENALARYDITVQLSWVPVSLVIT